ncbi:MAG TPA: hypothetical protein VGO78_13955 [Acidimicrobiales bacterium]|nr:hypothetical protein [Acidimicrobiales bacterium]
MPSPCAPLRPSAAARRPLALLLAASSLLTVALLVATPARAGADETDQADDAGTAEETLVIDLTEGTVTLDGASGTETVDPYGTDLNKEVGYRWDVCRAYRDGRVELIRFLAAQFPAIHELQGYACREIVEPGTPDCDGEWEPDYSTCWSTHAAGRAIDVIVGGELNSPTPEGVALGDEIVTWLLASRDGYDNYWARKMGIQQILWNDRCWSGQRADDQHVTSAGAMRWCGIANHDNHVHLTLSNAGADGLTSWFLELGAGYGAG